MNLFDKMRKYYVLFIIMLMALLNALPKGSIFDIYEKDILSPWSDWLYWLL